MRPREGGRAQACPRDSGHSWTPAACVNREPSPGRVLGHWFLPSFCGGENSRNSPGGPVTQPLTGARARGEKSGADPLRCAMLGHPLPRRDPAFPLAHVSSSPPGLS